MFVAGALRPARTCGRRHRRLPLHLAVACVGATWSGPSRADRTSVVFHSSKAACSPEFWQFLRQEKKYWLVPIVIVFVLFGLLIVFSQSSAVAPFIYTLF